MYELTYIISPLTADLDASATAAKVRSFITGNLGGEIKKEYLGDKKKLSYPIKKQTVGTYAIVEFQVEPERMDELKKFLELDTEVLRHLILNVREGALVKRPARVKPTTTAIPAEETSTKTEKVGIEELDKKLEELLK